MIYIVYCTDKPKKKKHLGRSKASDAFKVVTKKQSKVKYFKEFKPNYNIFNILF